MPRYQRHLDAAHQIWKKYHSADLIVDATCGNGHDALFLAGLEPKLLYALDINPEAVKKTAERLPPHTPVRLLCQSHAQFPAEILPESVDLIVYNLGYLPGGDKNATTLTATTLQSLQAACLLLKPQGLLSITCYPGHLEGEKEKEACITWAKTLESKVWSVEFRQWINRPKSPSLLLIEKRAR